MRLTFLGTSASYPGPGRACAGHLVQSGDTAVLLDCGNGVLANLGTAIDPAHLSAVCITHEHIDHFADIYALQAALRYSPAGPQPPLPLYLTPGLYARMRCALGEYTAHELDEAFLVYQLVADQPIAVGPLTVTPRLVEHVDPTFGLEVVGDGKRLFYTSDTRLGDAVRAVACGADLLLAEATLPEEYRGRAQHMTPSEAVTLAREAGVRALALTHLWPTLDRAEVRRTVRAQFAGLALVPDELDFIDIN